MRRWGAVWRSGLVVGALVVRAHAGDAGAGMEAHVDPSTGRLVPEPVDPGWRRPAIAALPAPVEVRAPGGGMMAVVPRQLASHLVATIEPDGSVKMDCIVPARER